MSSLPIFHLTLYKHGVAYFRRRGPVEGTSLKLAFRREDMDDLLKSLTVLDHGGGQVQGIDYDTPLSQEERLSGCSIILSKNRSLRDLLIALRGRPVQLQVSDGSIAKGLIVGLDEIEDKPLEQSLISILQQESEQVIILPLNRIEGVGLHDRAAADDLHFFLQTETGQETHRSITIRLSPGPHDLEVSYIAPAPTWRVSYRLVVDSKEDLSPEQKTEALLQGWGIFDNRLEEDLNNISISLTAGMPISFVYDLYTPHTPSRPVIEEEDRTAAGPVMFEQGFAQEEADEAFMMPPQAAAPAPKAARILSSRSVSAQMADTTASQASGKSLGELFQYIVDVPVTVGRGQSAMVPIISSRLKPAKDLIYNGAKMATHPVATLRFKNDTGLTLERGPVTVLENGEYVGEAILPFTANKAETIVSFAVELGVHIQEEHQSENYLQAIQIEDGYLLHQHYDIRRTIYHVDNRTPQAKTVLIERHINRGYITFETPEPAEQTLDTYRYKLKALPGKITELRVQERCLRARREELKNLSYRNLQKYFEEKFLDKHTYDALNGLLDIWTEIAHLEQTIADQEQRRDTLYKTQEQIQKNMVTLSKDGEEGRLRGRYVKQLTQSEESLAKIDQIVAKTQAEIEQKQNQLNQMIAELDSTKSR